MVSAVEATLNVTCDVMLKLLGAALLEHREIFRIVQCGIILMEKPSKQFSVPHRADK